MDVDERVVLHDPERGMTLRLDRVVPDFLEAIAHNLEAQIRLVPAEWGSETFAAEPHPNAVVGVNHAIVGDPDIPQDVFRGEKSAVEWAPEEVMYHGPRHVRPDADGAIPIIVFIAACSRLAVGGRALLPQIAGQLKRMRSLGCCFLADGGKCIGRALDNGTAQGDVGGGVSRNGCEPTVTQTDIRNFDIACLPEHEAAEAQSYIRANARIITVLVEFPRKVIE